MIKELVNDEKILSTPCEPASADDAELAQDLLDTLESLEDAACLAANQIGVTKAVIVYLDEKDNAHVMYNPKLLFGMNATKATEECLTGTGEKQVTRYQKAKVSYDELIDGKLKSRRREFRDWEAQIVQHMIDHCNGKLI